ncbi:hypothetical protein [Oceanicella sp. SM1341]|uniref:hypothetical protein n=1 Tax=Oceanicella sp. SM1341 TaxID=1548889 RepID=UPI000E4ABDF8|nr:hypothetical protein [Oceanicella sp. SM1341]
MDSDERLLAYMHGRLDAEAVADFEAELAARPALRAELAAMRAAAEVMAADTPRAEARARGWERLSRSIEAERTGRPANDPRRIPLWQAAGMAAAAVLVWQLAAVPYLTGPAPQPGGYQPAGEAAEGPTLRVAFAQDARLDAVADLLADLGARIVDGPGALGLFTLSFEDAAGRDAAEAALRARPGIVTSVTRP